MLLNLPDEELDDEDSENDFEDDFEEDFEDEEEDDLDFDDDEEEEEDGDEDEDEELTEEKEEEKERPIEESEEPALAAAQIVPDEEKLSAISPNDIPLSIILEVGRLKMSMQTLMDLQPGNTIELDIRPESGIDLVVNGSRVAKGELLQVGENLGIRILELG
ncbi:putative type III secretion translocase SctQ [Waddlia chondrophila 2032/99]|uniref:Putative type III secretion translocase SctQ n=1 Tax=Waddlia chondrophila 2032/99 TaxID=765953 RepID=F8LF18_9BACT|nr:putative type III secretion translocase SctQ [Waddlia chondrophila 2032/99]